jgi:large subunit ribosomal protein L20
VRAEGLTYGQFIHALTLANIDLDRKVLADIAMHEGEAFSAIIAQAKKALPKDDAKAA